MLHDYSRLRCPWFPLRMCCSTICSCGCSVVLLSLYHCTCRWFIPKSSEYLQVAVVFSPKVLGLHLSYSYNNVNTCNCRNTKIDNENKRCFLWTWALPIATIAMCITVRQSNTQLIARSARVAYTHVLDDACKLSFRFNLTMSDK